MLVLFETPAGHALFKVLKEKKLSKVDSIQKYFSTPDKAAEMVKLAAFQKFLDTTEAMSAAAAVVEGKLGSELKKFLKKNIVKKELSDTLGVLDTKLAGAIKDGLGINCVYDPSVLEVVRGIRDHMGQLIDGIEEAQINAMRLGLGHSLSRYKLKFSPDKIDTMIVQAIGLLDELDKEINVYAMRVKEWYGWHFPEMSKIVNDNLIYAKIVLKAGMRPNIPQLDLSDLLEQDLEEQLKETAIISMGTDISEEDLIGIKALCDQVISMMEYRAQLSEYLKNRMSAIAPNLTVMVGELVGARLIAHAGSLLNLAKQPASTVQLLGAEKSLFRALKTKHETPKYGLIYHASLVGQSQPKHKGKISRVLAAKTALSIRVDALGESSEPTIALDARARVEARLRQLETGEQVKFAGNAQARAPKTPVTSKPSAAYNSAADFTATPTAADESAAVASTKSSKKDKSAKKKKEKTVETPSAAVDESEKKDKSAKKKKDKKRKHEDQDGTETPAKTPKSAKKDKKKKKKSE